VQDVSNLTCVDGLHARLGFAMAIRIFARTVEKLVKTGKSWQYSYIVCFILVFLMKYGRAYTHIESGIE